MNKIRTLAVLFCCSILVVTTVVFWSLNVKKGPPPSPTTPNSPPAPVVLYAVNGTVLDGESWKTLTGAFISLNDSDGNSRRTVSGENGTYFFRCKAGAYTLSASLQGYTTTVKHVTLNNGDIIAYVIMSRAPSNLPPPNGTVITGWVSDAKTNLRLGGVQIKSGNYSTTTGSDGVYSLGVGMGIIQLTVTLDGYKTETPSVTVAQKTPYSLNVTMTPIPTVKVTINPNYMDTHLGRVSVLKVLVQNANRTPAVGVAVQFNYATKDYPALPARFDPQTIVTDNAGAATVNWYVQLDPIGPVHNTWWFCNITASVTIDGLQVAGIGYATVFQPCPTCTLN